MPEAELKRRVAFALALAALVLGAVLFAMDADGIDGARRSGMDASGPQEEGRGREIRAAALAAHRFVAAYLRYQEGPIDAAQRASLLLYSTPDLGDQLVRAPVRVDAAGRPPRQFVARVAGVQAGLFEDRPALLVAVVVAGEGGTHLLRTSLVEEDGSWFVAGIGP